MKTTITYTDCNFKELENILTPLPDTAFVNWFDVQTRYHHDPELFNDYDTYHFILQIKANENNFICIECKFDYKTDAQNLYNKVQPLLQRFKHKH